ncbi:hypothetical protein BKA60DRAFT_545264 [Fusarium oxysporum]|nr:hypothetical protein BKA60DRAFT_545264 [Fusarium oxysporum]
MSFSLTIAYRTALSQSDFHSIRRHFWLITASTRKFRQAKEIPVYPRISLRHGQGTTTTALQYESINANSDSTITTIITAITEGNSTAKKMDKWRTGYHGQGHPLITVVAQVATFTREAANYSPQNSGRGPRVRRRAPRAMRPPTASLPSSPRKTNRRTERVYERPDHHLASTQVRLQHQLKRAIVPLDQGTDQCGPPRHLGGEGVKLVRWWMGKEKEKGECEDLEMGSSRWEAEFRRLEIRLALQGDDVPHEGSPGSFRPGSMSWPNSNCLAPTANPHIE